MANMRYTRTVGQNGKNQFELQIEISMDTDSDTEPNLEVLNSFLTAITGERTSAQQLLIDGWIPIEDTEE